jgi:hypothetical protein
MLCQCMGIKTRLVQYHHHNIIQPHKSLNTFEQFQGYRVE